MKKGNKVLIHITVWMDHKILTQSLRSETQKVSHVSHVILSRIHKYTKTGKRLEVTRGLGNRVAIT